MVSLKGEISCNLLVALFCLPVVAKLPRYCLYGQALPVSKKGLVKWGAH